MSEHPDTEATTDAENLTRPLDLDTVRARLDAIFRNLRDFDPAPARGRLAQAGIGWLKGMADQGALYFAAVDAGIPGAAAPNVRLFLELSMMIQWLHEDGEAALDSLIRKAQNEASKAQEFFGPLWTKETLEDIDFLLSIETGHDRSGDRRAAVKHMAEVLGTKASYLGWWEQTRYSHGTMDLAIAYAPAAASGVLAKGSPPGIEFAVPIQLALLLSVGFVARILRAEGDQSVGTRLLDAYFGGINDGLRERGFQTESGE
ncbi:hypothetical protein ACLRGF_05515 [Mycetocola zhadangensis]|uniref:hypothetical protein n=1 Tax=Mycetocola zhadangensis TaxID=1164595 RepID=UPI003A4D4F37